MQEITLNLNTPEVLYALRITEEQAVCVLPRRCMLALAQLGRMMGKKARLVGGRAVIIAAQRLFKEDFL
jgi:hypothetical protein